MDRWMEVHNQHQLDKQTFIPTVLIVENGVLLVDCDPDNPLNWPHGRRAVITFLLHLYISVIYMSSAIYTPSEDGVMKEVGVNHSEAALGLALFVLGKSLLKLQEPNSFVVDIVLGCYSLAH